MPATTVHSDMLRYYGQGRESGRLERGLGLLEGILRTREILERILAPAPATIWDVGGAMGVYAFGLAIAHKPELASG